MNWKLEQVVNGESSFRDYLVSHIAQRDIRSREVVGNYEDLPKFIESDETEDVSSVEIQAKVAELEAQIAKLTQMSLEEVWSELVLPDLRASRDHAGDQYARRKHALGKLEKLYEVARNLPRPEGYAGDMVGDINREIIDAINTHKRNIEHLAEKIASVDAQLQRGFSADEAAKYRRNEIAWNERQIGNYNERLEASNDYVERSNAFLKDAWSVVEAYDRINK